MAKPRRFAEPVRPRYTLGVVWLVDGYNVIRRDPELTGIDRRNLEEGRAALLRAIARVARDSPDVFVVIFDGVRSKSSGVSEGRVRALFSRPPERADDVLVRMARDRGVGATVVTSDRAVQTAARRARSAVVSADAFLDRLNAPIDDESDRIDDDPASAKRGNPRRPSRRERATRHALRRLGPGN